MLFLILFISIFSYYLFIYRNEVKDIDEVCSFCESNNVSKIYCNYIYEKENTIITVPTYYYSCNDCKHTWCYYTEKGKKD